jgi:hypothetical protein
MRPNHIESAGAVVAVFAKIFGNHHGPDHEKDANSEEENKRGTNKVPGIPEKPTQDDPRSETVFLSVFADA